MRSWQVAGTRRSRPSAAVLGALLLAALGPAGSARAEAQIALAYVPPATPGCYDTPLLAAAQAAATAGDATLTVLVVEDPDAQARQLEDAVVSGAYDGIIVQPPLGDSLVPAVEAAIAAGIAIANVDRVLGQDLTTSVAQVDGLAANVVVVPVEIGRKLGALAMEACGQDGPGPCRVGYLSSARDATLGDAIRAGFDAAITADPDVRVVAEATGIGAEGGLAAGRDLLAAQPDIDVIVGSDQAITGVLQAADEGGLADGIAMVGYGGGAVAVQGVQAGDRFGTVMQVPGTEGRLVVEYLLAAIRTGEAVPGVDPAAQLPDEGIVRAGNAAAFTPEWPG
jgi:ribose transport system substrate-binding protein